MQGLKKARRFLHPWVMIVMLALAHVNLAKTTKLMVNQINVPHFFTVEISNQTNTLEITAPKYPFYTLATINFLPTACVQINGTNQYAFQDVSQTQRSKVTTFRAHVYRRDCVGVHRSNMTLEKVVVAVKKGLPVGSVGLDTHIFLYIGLIVPLAAVFVWVFLREYKNNPVLLPMQGLQQGSKLY